MEQRSERVAVRCEINQRLFGARKRGMMDITVIGNLVHEQGPYEASDGETCEGWPDHFDEFEVYAHAAGGTYPLFISTLKIGQACHWAAISTLRATGHLVDADEEILAQYP